MLTSDQPFLSRGGGDGSELFCGVMAVVLTRAAGAASVLVARWRSLSVACFSGPTPLGADGGRRCPAVYRISHPRRPGFFACSARGVGFRWRGRSSRFPPPAVASAAAAFSGHWAAPRDPRLGRVAGPGVVVAGSGIYRAALHGGLPAGAIRAAFAVYSAVGPGGRRPRSTLARDWHRPPPTSFPALRWFSTVLP